MLKYGDLMISECSTPLIPLNWMDPLIEATKMKFHNEPKELIDEYLLKSKIDFK